jgi:5-oxoprolinase (ATP-hydrolysing)
MNNFTFGDGQLGYYETVAGGAGAGPGWHGTSGVQSHMTNTRITDPEVLERRLPVALREFSLRAGSGGRGRFRGGDGVVREVEFLRPLTACLLSERRSLAPFGLEGGGEAQRGVNLLITREEQVGGEGGGGGASPSPSSSSPLSRELVVNLGGKATVEVQAGDRIRILTPGGGGFGKEGEEEGTRGGGDEEEAKRAASTLLSTAAAAAAALPRASGSVHAYAQAQETA